MTQTNDMNKRPKFYQHAMAHQRLILKLKQKMPQALLTNYSIFN